MSCWGNEFPVGFCEENEFSTRSMPRILHGPTLKMWPFLFFGLKGTLWRIERQWRGFDVKLPRLNLLFFLSGPSPSPSPVSTPTPTSRPSPAQQPMGSFGTTTKPAATQSADAFSDFMPFNTKQEPKTLAEKQQHAQSGGQGQGFSQFHSAPTSYRPPSAQPAHTTPAGWDADFFETGNKPSSVNSTPKPASSSSGDGNSHR